MRIDYGMVHIVNEQVSGCWRLDVDSVELVLLVKVDSL